MEQKNGKPNNISPYFWGMCGIIDMVHKRDDAAKLLINHLLIVAEDASKHDWGAVRDFTNACFELAQIRYMNVLKKGKLFSCFVMFCHRKIELTVRLSNECLISHNNKL